MGIVHQGWNRYLRGATQGIVSLFIWLRLIHQSTIQSSHPGFSAYILHDPSSSQSSSTMSYQSVLMSHGPETEVMARNGWRAGSHFPLLEPTALGPTILGPTVLELYYSLKSCKYIAEFKKSANNQHWSCFEKLGFHSPPVVGWSCCVFLLLPPWLLPYRSWCCIRFPYLVVVNLLYIVTSRSYSRNSLSLWRHGAHGLQLATMTLPALYLTASPKLHSALL